MNTSIRGDWQMLNRNSAATNFGHGGEALFRRSAMRAQPNEKKARNAEKSTQHKVNNELTSKRSLKTHFQIHWAHAIGPLLTESVHTAFHTHSAE